MKWRRTRSERDQAQPATTLTPSTGRAASAPASGAATGFIPGAGACLVSKNVLTGAGRVKWLVREESKAAVDNGWRIFSDIDTDDYLHDADSLEIVDFNRVCEIEPAVIGVWDLPVGSDLQIVDEGAGLAIVDTATGQEIPREALFDPTAPR